MESKKLGKYELLEPLGSSVTAEVYRAREKKQYKHTLQPDGYSSFVPLCFSGIYALVGN